MLPTVTHHCLPSEFFIELYKMLMRMQIESGLNVEYKPADQQQEGDLFYFDVCFRSSHSTYGSSEVPEDSNDRLALLNWVAKNCLPTTDVANKAVLYITLKKA